MVDKVKRERERKKERKKEDCQLHSFPLLCFGYLDFEDEANRLSQNISDKLPLCAP